MRSINGELERRLKLLQQTAYNNANPAAIVHISRPTSALTDERYLDKTLVGEFSGLSTSSIATRRMRKGGDIDRVYIGYIANGIAKIKWAKSVPAMEKHLWNDGGFSVEAIDISVCFDGSMPKKVSGAEFITDARPWVFWVTPEGVLKGRILGLLGETTLAASNCTKVSAVRATWGEQGSLDFGLVVFFLLGGDLYYRQLIDGEWMDAEPVSFGPAGVSWADIAAFRTWDYRVGVQGLTTGGDVYELFVQYQGFAKHGTEHIELHRVASTGQLTAIAYHNFKSSDEHIEIANVAANPAQYGGLYDIRANIVNAYNVADGNSDWGKIAIFVFDSYLVAADVAAQPTAFSIVDSQNVSFNAASAVLGSDGKTVTLTFLDFNNASGACLAKYTPGTVTNMAGASLVATSYSWTPVNLVPTATPAPEVYSITNAGITDIGYNRVRFYSTDGQTLLHLEYVENGGDCSYGSTEIWATSANSGISVSGITENVQNSMDLYLARWTVKYYSKDGLALLHTEYVVDGEDATWGAGREWADTAEGQAVTGILDDINGNISVYKVSSVLIEMTPLVHVFQSRYSTGATTYTAPAAMRVLAINANSHTNTNSTRCTATITTTGTVLSTDTRTSTSASSSSVTAGEITISIIELAAGDTVTFTNNSVSYTRQFHLLYATSASSITNNSFEVWPDSKSSNTRNISLNSSKTYLCLAYEISEKTRSQLISASVSPTDNSDADDDTYYYAYEVAEVAAESSVTLTTANVTNYIGSLMATYELL